MKQGVDDIEKVGKHLLVGVDNGRQVDLAVLDGLLEHGDDPASSILSVNMSMVANGDEMMLLSLFRVRRVDDHGILGLLVLDQVGVVIATTHPYIRDQLVRQG